MRWKELRSDDGQWLGLELTVERRPRPEWRVEFAYPFRLRLVSQDSPLLWGRMDRYYQRLWWLTASSQAQGPLPPLQAREVDTIREEPASSSWYAAWAKHFALMLSDSPLSPLHEGSWQLRRGLPLREPGGIPEQSRDVVGVWNVEDYPSQRHTGHLDWWKTRFPEPLLGWKDPGALSPSRLKVWRKYARRGNLPPVLALFVVPLTTYVVLDGHHRWMAALQEQKPVPLLVLWYARWHSLSANPEQQTRLERLYLQQAAGLPPAAAMPVSMLNTLALKAWSSWSYSVPRTRGWPQAGGGAAWQEEVRERLDALGPSVADFIRKALLDHPSPLLNS